MSFLAPWFLLGALAVAGPILFHLIRRAARERTTFSSTMFLRPTAPRVTRRRRIEHWPLLLLRCACLGLLATAFARPLISRNLPALSPPDGSRDVVLLIDTSASMRRSGVWESALARAGKFFENVSPSDRVAIVAFDRHPRTLVNLAEWSTWPMQERAARARERMELLKPSWMGTDFGLALTTAAEQLAQETSPPASRRQIVLISDLQEGANLGGLQGYDWPSEVKVIVERVDSKDAANAGLEILRNPRSPAGEPKEFVRIANSRDSVRETFRLAWIDAAGRPRSETTECYIAPGKIATLPLPGGRGGATRLALSGDNHAFDNLAFFAPPQTQQVTVAYIGSDAPHNPEALRYYVERVFSDSASGIRIQATPGNALGPDALHETTLALIAGQLPPDKTTLIRDWVHAGKTALLVLSGVEMAETLSSLMGIQNLQVTDSTAEYALLSQIDFSHPLFAPFADPRFSDFTRIHFWKHRIWQRPQEFAGRILAEFDDGAPALVELAMGRGKLLVLTSGWHPTDSQFALSSKFPTLMQRLVDWSGGNRSEASLFATGEPIASPLTAASSAGNSMEWRKPDGSVRRLDAGSPFTETELPGIYTASAPGREWQFAVNLPLQESRTAPLALDDLARLGIPMQDATTPNLQTIVKQRAEAQRTERESEQKLWRWLIVAALVVIFCEVLLSGWLARRIPPAEVPA